MVAPTQKITEIWQQMSKRSETSETSETFWPPRAPARSVLGLRELHVSEHFTGQKVSDFSEVSDAEASAAEILAWVQACIRRAYEPDDQVIPAPPSWACVEAVPFPGCQCIACGSQSWWSDGSGWACTTCHPPNGGAYAKR